MKKFVALVLALLTVLALCVPAFATEKPVQPILALTTADLAEISGATIYEVTDDEAIITVTGTDFQYAVKKGFVAFVNEIKGDLAYITLSGGVAATVPVSALSKPAAGTTYTIDANTVITASPVEINGQVAKLPVVEEDDDD